MSDLNSLIIFAHVVDANGFSKAARRLKMPTSTVSRRIAELEQTLGVRLIERSTRSLRLTDGIGDLPPIVQPELLRSGRLVEVMPRWHFQIFHLSLCHLGSRFVPRPVRVFKDFAATMAAGLFPTLPA